MSLPGPSIIEQTLQQMRAIVLEAQGKGTLATDSAASVSGFSAELGRSLKRVSAAQNAATAKAKEFELGAPDISLSDVMIDLQKASIGFQTVLQVRKKLVEAYKEISAMAV